MRTTCPALLVLCVSGLAVAGCASMQKKNRVAEGLVEPPQARSALTPVEQGRQYQAAFSEGLTWVQNGEYGAALGAFEKAVELKPNSTGALFNLGACHEAIGDPARAINIYRSVLALSPNDADCYANLGTCYIKMYYREKSPLWRKMARGAWQQSLKLKAGQPDVQRFLAATESVD
jgi:tetratricopeptide (TPR) repeat protein